MTGAEIEAKLRAALPDAHVQMTDLTGTSDHWKVLVVSVAFHGKSHLERHRMINTLFAQELKGPIHALTMDLVTPDEHH